MTLVAQTWPDAAVAVALIVSVGLVLAVLVWSIFRTGQTAIRSHGRERDAVDGLRKEVAELRARLQESAPVTPGE
jgi:cytochrome c-type biogenesis protein CcmH/NrfG